MSRNANIVFERHRGELDVTQGARAQGLSGAAWILAAGGLVAALFGAGALRDWGFELTFSLGQGADPVFQLADGWFQAMQEVGLTQPYQAARDWFHGLPFRQF